MRTALADSAPSSMVSCWRRLGRRASADSGAAAAEFAAIAPILMLLSLGVIQFGPVLKQLAVLQVAAHQGAQMLSTGRTSTSIQTQTLDVIDAAIATLDGTVTVTLSVCDSAGGTCTTCNSDASCATLLTSAQGDAAEVQLSYPCALAYPVVSVNSVCNLTVNEYALVQ